MKTTLLISLITIAAASNAQESKPLHLWADPQRLGPVQQVVDQPGLVEELRFDLQGRVSSLEVGAGYTVTFYDREQGAGVHSLTLVGPARIDDLEALPMLSLKGNWDDAVGSLQLQRTDAGEELPPVLAEVQQ